MKRVTTDNPKTNTEKLMNYCTADNDGWAVLGYAGGEENIRLHEYTAKCCIEHGCEFVTADFVAEDGLFDCCDCPVAIMYYCGGQAAENNARLKAYEDTGVTPEEIILNKSIIGDLGREVCREGREIKKLRELLKAAVTSLKCMADIVREVHKDDCICGMCEFDFDTTVGESGECYGECPGFERNDCFRCTAFRACRK